MLQILLSVWILDVGILYYKSEHFLKYLILMLTNWVWMWAITETITMISRHMSWIDCKYKCRVLFALYLLSHWFLGVFGWRPVCRQWSIRSWALSTVCSDWNCWRISDDHNHWLQPLFSQQLKPRAVMSDCVFLFFFSFSNAVFEKSCSENKRHDQRRELAKTDDIQGRRIWCCTVHVL